MHSASLIILVLSHAGYWLAGTDGIVSIRWTVPNQTPQAALVWELFIGSDRLDHGSVAVNGGEAPTEIKIKCPPVRARTELELRYRLVSVDATRELASGSVAVHAFPDNLTGGWARLLQGKNVAAVDAIDGLPALLARAGVDCTRMDQASELQFGRPDLVLIAADRLDESPFTQSFLIEQARAGAGVMIFEQSKISRLIGYAVVSRARPDRLQWMRTHPLLTGFSADDLKSWIDDLPVDVPAVRLPQDASALQIAGWPNETAGDGISKPSEAMILSQNVGSGHIVWCQLPLGSWRTDPRTVMFLGNALDYLSTPSEQASANRRQVNMPAMQARVPMVLTPAGDNR